MSIRPGGGNVGTLANTLRKSRARDYSGHSGNRAIEASTNESRRLDGPEARRVSQHAVLRHAATPLLLAKRIHGSQRVHIVPPMHNLAVHDSNDRDESIVVGCAGSDNLTVHIVLENHYTGILRFMDN
jgi:hypothetical protein